VSSEGISVPDPLVFANAPPANAKDIPATPNSGAARLPRFFLGACFVCDIPASNTLDPKKFRRMDRKDFAVQKRSDSLDYALSLLRSETNFCVSNLKSSCLPALASNHLRAQPDSFTRCDQFFFRVRNKRRLSSNFGERHLSPSRKMLSVEIATS
jgi:hypothetical protein